MDKVGRGGEEMAGEKSGRPRGRERGLGKKTEEPVTQTVGGREGPKSVCERPTAKEEGNKQGKQETGVRGWRERFPATFCPTDALWPTAASGALGRRLTLCWGAKRGQGVSTGTERRGSVPSPSSGGCPSAQVNHPSFPLLDVKSPFHPATLLNCCKTHL